MQGKKSAKIENILSFDFTAPANFDKMLKVCNGHTKITANPLGQAPYD